MVNNEIRQKSLSKNRQWQCLIFEPYKTSLLYTHPLDFLALRHLSRLSLCSAELETLVIPALGTNLVQGLLALAVESRAVLATAVPRLHRLDKTGVLAVQRVTL